MQLTIALAAETASGVQALRLCASRGHRVVTVFTDSGEGESLASLASVASVAESLGVPVRPASEVCKPALASSLMEQEVELFLNVDSLHLVNADVLEAPVLGAYNLHPGPLPECAGLNAPSWALYEGAARHGVTLHRMTPAFDEGPITFADTFDLQRSDTGLSVLVQCIRRGLRMVERLLDLAERGEAIPEHSQDLTRRRWFGAGPPDNGHLDWRRPARCAVDFVRACDYRPFNCPWGFPRCIVHGLDVAILRASVGRDHAGVAAGTVTYDEDGVVLIAAADAWVRIEQVEVDGRGRPAVDVFRNVERLELIDGDPYSRIAS